MILRVNFDQGVRANRKHMNIFQHLRTQMEEMGNSSSDMLLKKPETHYSMSKHQQTNNIGVVVTRDNLTWRETLSNTARPTVSSNDEVLWIVPPDYEETKAGRTSLRKAKKNTCAQNCTPNRDNTVHSRGWELKPKHGEVVLTVPAVDKCKMLRHLQ